MTNNWTLYYLQHGVPRETYFSFGAAAQTMATTMVDHGIAAPYRLTNPDGHDVDLEYKKPWWETLS